MAAASIRKWEDPPQGEGIRTHRSAPGADGSYGVPGTPRGMAGDRRTGFRLPCEDSFEDGTNERQKPHADGRGPDGIEFLPRDVVGDLFLARYIPLLYAQPSG